MIFEFSTWWRVETAVQTAEDLCCTTFVASIHGSLLLVTLLLLLLLFRLRLSCDVRLLGRQKTQCVAAIKQHCSYGWNLQLTYVSDEFCFLDWFYDKHFERTHSYNQISTCFLLNKYRFWCSHMTKKWMFHFGITSLQTRYIYFRQFQTPLVLFVFFLCFLFVFGSL